MSYNILANCYTDQEHGSHLNQDYLDFKRRHEMIKKEILTRLHHSTATTAARQHVVHRFESRRVQQQPVQVRPLLGTEVES